MAKKESVAKLKGNIANPRVTTDAKMAKLKRDLARLGDLSGVIFNVTTQQLVGGHQRSKIFQDGDAKIEIVTRYDAPTSQGTVAEGFITWKNSRYAYREVKWAEEMEKEANIVANTHAGEFDYAMLGANYEVKQLQTWGLSINFAPPAPLDDPPPIVKRDPLVPNADPMEDGGGNDSEEDDRDHSLPDDGGDETPPPAPSVQGAQGMLFPVNATLNKVQHLLWSEIKEKLGKRRDTEAFTELMERLKNGGIDKIL